MDQDLTLDPEDWGEFRAQAHRMLDDMLLNLATVGERPAWQPIPDEVQQTFEASRPPQQGAPLADVYRAFVTSVLPYSSGNRHPRAWGWVRGTGTPLSMLADMLASGLNAHVGGGLSAPVLVEEQVVGWLARMLEMPAGTGGVLTSGASMANLQALVVARHAQVPQSAEQGLSGLPRMLVYCSSETHFWVRKAVHTLGLGQRSLRRVAVQPDGTIDLSALQEAIVADRALGHLPLAVVANAGTVNTGAFDDLRALREVCDRQRLWLHVDGAFGAWLKLAPTHKHLVAGLESADSVAFDLHKWGYLPFGTGCLLVKRGALLQASFQAPSAYMQPEARGLLSGSVSLSDRGMEGSRDFKALRVWMALQVHGTRKLGALVEQNLRQAEHLASTIEQTPELCLLAPCVANIVCFRYQPAASTAMTAAELDGLQRAILGDVAESGAFLLSGTTLQGAAGEQYALRIAVVNHRSTLADFDALVATVLATGRKLAQQTAAV